jgi:hypothetical protein
MSSYNQEQTDAILIVRRNLEGLPASQLRWLEGRIKSYLQFRATVARFQDKYFADICSQKCFTSQTSACCGREGIITFFADVVINVFLSSEKEIDELLRTLAQDMGGFNCVYLTDSGCLWRLKPIVCEMFLCEHAKKTVLNGNSALGTQWERLRRQERQYTWPNQPVLFDELESFFIEAGFDSPLMYFHHSPGLLRVKARSAKGRNQASNGP